MATFSKPPLHIDEQIILFKRRGLIIEDDQFFHQILNNISFFRFRSYAGYFMNAESRNYKEGTKLEDIYRLYLFDDRLRSLLFEAITPLEIALRTQMVNVLSLKYGSHWYMISDNFNNRNYHTQFIEKVRQSIKEQENHEYFIKKYLSDYSEPEYPPAWMLWEIFSLGTLSKTFSALHHADQSVIARHFNVHEHFLESWFQTFSYIRNLSAHHSRVWNRALIIQPKIPTREKNKFLITKENIDNKRIYYSMCCIQKLSQRNNWNFGISEKLKELLKAYKEVSVSKMGFTSDWEAENIWR